MKIGIPQVIWFVMGSIALFNNLEHHGEQRNDKYNIVTALIAFAINFGLMWWGGFFG